VTISSRAARLGGAALIGGSIFFVLTKLSDMSLAFLNRPMADVIAGEDIVLVAVGNLLLVAGYVTFFRLYAPRLAGPGRTGTGLVALGGTVLAAGHLVFTPLGAEWQFILVIIGLLTLLIGLTLFGLANLRRPVMARWQALPLATAGLGFVAFMALGGEDKTAGFLFFRTLFAVGLAGLGSVMLFDPGRRAA
jgi:hypothetical protein